MPSDDVIVKLVRCALKYLSAEAQGREQGGLSELRRVELALEWDLNGEFLKRALPEYRRARLEFSGLEDVALTQYLCNGFALPIRKDVDIFPRWVRWQPWRRWCW